MGRLEPRDKVLSGSSGRAKMVGERMSRAEIEGLENGINTLSDVVQRAKGGVAIPESRTTFVNACLQQTDNVRPRLTRFMTLRSSI